MSTGVLISSFDLYNVADLDVLRQAGERCDRLVVAVLTDAGVESLTGLPPVVPEHERLAIVAAVAEVADAILYDPDDVAALKPDVLFTDASLPLDAEVLFPRERTASEVLRAVLNAHAAGVKNV